MNRLAPRLDLRQTQQLVMTPQLQQAIKLLQLSNLEVAQFVEEELAQNPLLERDEAPAVEYLRAIQDALGELQDIRIIEAALDRLDPAEQPGQPFRHRLRDRRYEALEHWRRLRRARGAPVLAFAADPALPGAD